MNQEGVYCIFCKSYTDEGVEIFLKDLGYTVIPAKREKIVFKNKKPIKQIHRLLPGYVFFTSPSEPDWPRIRRYESVLCPLGYAEADQEDEKGKTLPPQYSRRLLNRDLEFVQWLIRQKGLIKLSKAVFEGKRLVITEGPLKDLENNIVKMNRRWQCAEVELPIGASVLRTWLFFTVSQPRRRRRQYCRKQSGKRGLHFQFIQEQFFEPMQFREFRF